MTTVRLGSAQFQQLRGRVYEVLKDEFTYHDYKKLQMHAILTCSHRIATYRAMSALLKAQDAQFSHDTKLIYPKTNATQIHLCSLLDILLECTQESVLLLRSLVCTVTEL